jgi:hypothetical protein
LYILFGNGGILFYTQSKELDFSDADFVLDCHSHSWLAGYAVWFYSVFKLFIMYYLLCTTMDNMSAINNLLLVLV